MVYFLIVPVLLVYFSLIFIISKKHNRLDFIDVGWGGGFIIVAIISYFSSKTYLSLIVLGLSIIWASRLSYYIFQRFRIKGADQRYLELSQKWTTTNFWLSAYFKLFLNQALLVLIISLPISLASFSKHFDLSLIIIGLVIFTSGYIIELIADQQLKSYLHQPLSLRPKICNNGLWRYSRHPNYFGEITLWFGLATLTQNFHGIRLIGYLGPVVLAFLIIKVSGIPPIENKRQNNLEYLKYSKTTNKLIPWFNKH